MEHIRKNEWVKDSEENGWFNGYYDNHGRQVEGDTKTGVRMMLTGQVFPSWLALRQTNRSGRSRRVQTVISNDEKWVATV